MRNVWVGIIVFLVIIVCLLFQFNILNLIPLFGVVANIGIVFVVSLGILSGQKIGITVGVVYGILMDILFGKSFGIYTFLFFLIGFFCGKISHGFSKENKVSVLMIVAATTLIYEAICYFLFVIIYKYDFMFLSTFWTMILECVYNVFIAWVFFKPFSFLADIINKGKRSYYLL